MGAKEEIKKSREETKSKQKRIKVLLKRRGIWDGNRGRKPSDDVIERFRKVDLTTLFYKNGRCP